MLLRSGRACLVAIGRGLIRPVARPFLKRDLGRALRAQSGPFLVLQQAGLQAPQSTTTERVVGALAVVQRYAPELYRQILRDMTTVYVAQVSRAHYLVDLHVCVLPIGQVLEEEPTTLAFTLVHEAAHARIARAGIGWWPRTEGRIESACLRREGHLASRLEVAGFDVAGMREWLAKANRSRGAE